MKLLRALALSASSLLGCVAPGTAQVPSWSPEYATAGLGGTTYALATFQQELYAGGEWFAAKGGLIRGIARFDGAEWRPLATGVDLVNYSYPYLGPWVRAMTVFQGELVIAGIFDRAGGVPANYVARWNGSAFRPLGAGLQLTFDEADIRALAVYNGELYAAGHFDRAGSVAASGVARWDGTTWSPLGSGLVNSVSASLGIGRSLRVHQGMLVVGGSFDRAGGIVAQNVAAWNGTSWSALGTGALSSVLALESFGTQLVAAANFQVGSGVEMVAAWNGASWSALGSGAPTTPVTTLLSAGANLYADAGGTLVRFDGVSWALMGIVSGIFNGNEGTSIRTLGSFGAEIVLGGQFTSAGSSAAKLEVASSNVVAFDGTSRWRHLGGGLGLGGRTERILPWRGGWVAAGNFTEAGAARAEGVAIYDGDRWNSVARFDGPVWSAAIHQDGIVVSGSFTRIDGVPFPGIARWDGSAWHAFGTIAPYALHSHNGSLYGYGGPGLQRWNGSTFVVVATVVGVVGSLHSHVDGKLYVATGSAFQHAIHVWDGAVLTQIGAPNDFVHALGSYGTELVVGGRFTAVQGVAANLVARWNGTAWRAMPAPVSGYSADAFAELEGVLYAGISGDPRGLCLRLVNGNWQPLGAGIDGLPKLLFADRTTGSMFASGTILTAGGVPSRNLAEWRTQPAWRNRLHGLGGASGVPLLLGRGEVRSGTPIAWTVEAVPSLPLVLVLGDTRVDLPLLGGTLVPMPVITVAASTDAQGRCVLAATLPQGLGAGAAIHAQAWLLDASGPFGLTATNALQANVP